MRLLLALGLLWLGTIAASSQTVQNVSSEDSPVHPDMVVFIRPHSTGANLVKISMVEPSYPSDLLQRQINDLCDRLNFPPRGLVVYTEQMVAGNPKLQFLEATFATAGLMRDDGSINLIPLVQAFAGAPPPHTVKGMTVIFDEFTPTAKTLKDFRSPALIVHGRVDQDPPQVEYDVQLLSQKPGDFDISSASSNVEQASRRVQRPQSSTWLIWGLIILGGLAAGGLVYFLLTKRLPDDSSTGAAGTP